MFSSRLPPSFEPNQLTRALAEARASGRPLLDLTQSNPTTAGFEGPRDLLEPLASPPSRRYAPAPLGTREAREAVAADYGRRGVTVAPGRIALTASSSDAYSQLFKLLANPGDEVLVPRPSYPLFDHLASLDALAVRTYDLEYHGRWSVDMDSVARATTPRTRAILAVSPNNPTGSFLKRDELDALTSHAAGAGAAVIVDEVFADYVLDPAAAEAAGRPLEQAEALTFSLGGLSKSVGLPQVKLGWIAIAGPDGLARAALERLEYIGDTYLGVSTPVQVAAASFLSRGAAIRSAIQARLAGNLSALACRLEGAPACRALHVEGGWYVVVQVPAIHSEEAIVLRLLTEDGVLVHPGYFFDFSTEAFLVLSLLTPPDTFATGVDRLLRRVAA